MKQTSHLVCGFAEDDSLERMILLLISQCCTQNTLSSIDHCRKGFNIMLYLSSREPALLSGTVNTGGRVGGMMPAWRKSVHMGLHDCIPSNPEASTKAIGTPPQDMFIHTHTHTCMYRHTHAHLVNTRGKREVQMMEC